MAEYGDIYNGNGSTDAPPAGNAFDFRQQSDPHDGGSMRSREKDRDRERDRDKEREREKHKDREHGRDKHRERDHENKERSRDRERGCDRERDRERERDGDTEREHDRHHRDHRERSERRDHGRDRYDDRDRRRSRGESERRRERDDKEGRRRHRSRSRSKDRSERRSRSRSRSRSKSKRVSGFDMAPPSALVPPAVPATSAILPGLPGLAPAVAGMLPNMFPFQTGQFPQLAVIQPQAMTQQATRHARRVYVGGLPPTANEQSVAIFFNQVMAAIGGNTAGPGDAVLNVYINHDKKFAFVEMRSVEEASNAMALDGIIFEGAPVKVRRPTDYNPSLAAALGPSQPNPNLNLAAVGLTPGSAGGLEGPDRIFVGGLPYYFTEVQVRELLEAFGPLRGFDLVKDRETGNSKGYAFCVYQDLAVTDIACAALNGIKMGDKTLTVRRANQGLTQPRPEQENILLQAQQQVQIQKLVFQGGGALPTKVVCLTQVVTPDELRDDDEYEDIMEDMRGEGGKYGILANVVIPRPSPNPEETVPGLGKVFLEYLDTEGSSKARLALHGRKFGGNLVVAIFYPEDKFAAGDYGG